MAKELMTVELKDKVLIEKTAKIRAYENGVKTSLFGIAHIMQEIQKGELYKADGFKNIIDYAGQVFGYKKTMVYNMLQVAENYLQAGENKTVFAVGEKDFSMGQVQELLALPPAKSKELVKAGAINAEMTAKEIRDVVKENKPRKPKDAKKAMTERKKREEKLEKAKEENSSQQETTTTANTTAENPAAENVHVKKIEKIFSEMIADLNTLKVAKTETEKLARIMQGVVDLRKELGLLTL